MTLFPRALENMLNSALPERSKKARREAMIFQASRASYLELSHSTAEPALWQLREEQRA